MSTPEGTLAEIKKTLPEEIQEALDFEKKQWIDGSILTDKFYDISDVTNAHGALPGTILKIERDCDSSKYMTPSTTSISRFVYQSQAMNGSLVPVSALMLWPYAPRRSADGYQVVAWSHGTSGLTKNWAPSHTKNLWQHYLAPFNLALQGYVVVMTDYAGLGVAIDASGKTIVHEYLASPSSANDVFYSVQAAQAAFPELSKNFVIAGHSQGGNSVWACAERQSIEPVDGYLGSITISPVTDARKEPEPIRSILICALLNGLKNNFPNFDLADVLTDEAAERLRWTEQLECTGSILMRLFVGITLLKPDWQTNPYIQKYLDMISAGSKSIGGPLLVIHGSADENLSIDVVTAAVQDTVRVCPTAKIEFREIPGVSHNGTILAGQPFFMDWIADRFAGVLVEPGYKYTKVESARPPETYQSKQTWYLEQATKFYHTP